MWNVSGYFQAADGDSLPTCFQRSGSTPTCTFASVQANFHNAVRKQRPPLWPCPTQPVSGTDIGRNTCGPPLSAMTSVTFAADELETADGRLIERSPLHSSIIPALVPSELSSGERCEQFLTNRQAEPAEKKIRKVTPIQN